MSTTIAGLTPEELEHVSKTLFALHWAEARENEGLPVIGTPEHLAAPTRELTKLCPWNAVIAPQAMALTAHALGRVQQAWNVQNMTVFFFHADVQESESRVHLVTDLLLGCYGHGVTIDDDFAEALDRAESAYRVVLGPTPVNLDDGEWIDLALEWVERTAND